VNKILFFCIQKLIFNIIEAHPKPDIQPHQLGLLG